MPTSDLLTTREVAEALGISPGRVRHLILSGRLPAQKRGRDLLVHASDLALVALRKPGNHTGRPRRKAEQAS